MELNAEPGADKSHPLRHSTGVEIEVAQPALSRVLALKAAESGGEDHREGSQQRSRLVAHQLARSFAKLTLLDQSQVVVAPSIGIDAGCEPGHIEAITWSVHSTGVRGVVTSVCDEWHAQQELTARLCRFALLPLLVERARTLPASSPTANEPRSAMPTRVRRRRGAIKSSCGRAAGFRTR